MGEPSDRLSIRLLGPFQVLQADRVIIDDAWPYTKAKHLLKLLALAPDHTLRREQIIDALWPELSLTAAGANLRKCLHRVRQRFAEFELPTPIARSSNDAVALTGEITLDTDSFRIAAAAARASGRLDAYEEALSLYPGDLLAHDVYEEWGKALRLELERLRADLAFERATLLLARGRRGEAIGAIERLLDDDSTDEQAHRMLMRLYAHAGARERAIRQYQSCRAAVQSELAVEPSPETSALFQEIVAARFVPTAAPPLPLFGREHEVGLLHAAVRAALVGQPRCVLISGDPGIGKTEIVIRASHLAELYGLKTVWGRCHEGQGVPAYWPWLQVIRGCEPGQRRHGAREPGGQMLELLPYDASAPRVGTRELAESEASRAQLFERILRYFRATAERQPLLIAVEDLHWADAPSLLLLRFIVRELRAVPLIILGTYRDVEAQPHTTLSEALSELRTQPSTVQVDLAGLDAPDVRDFVREASGIEISPAVAEALHQRTGGNPLFIKEIVRSLGHHDLEQDAGNELRFLRQTPATARDVIRRRMTRLSPETAHILSVAAVIGREFDLELLGRATATPAEQLAALLDEALVHRAIEPVAGEVGEYQFAHALFRDAIYEDLPVGRRMALHRRIAEAIAACGDAENHVAALAHHYYEAAPLGLSEKAAEYMQKAGDQAKVALAYEEAITYYERALQLHNRAGLTDGHTELKLLLSLGQVTVWSGRGAAARDFFLRAADVARRIGSSEGLARTAVAYKNIPGRPTAPDPILLSLAEEAVAALPDDDSALRAVLLATLGWSLRGTSQHERRQALFEVAIPMARRVGEPHALADVLAWWFDSEWRPENIPQRLAAAEEMMATGRRIQNPRMMNRGAYRRLVGLLETANIGEFDRCLETHWALAESVGQEDCKSWFMLARCTRAVLEGRFDRAEEYAQEAYRLLERFGDPDAFRIFASQLFAVRWPQGRLGELEPASRMHSPDNAVPGWRISLGLLALEAGNEAAARAEFERFAVTDFDLPHDRTWMLCVVVLSEICRGLRDVTRAAKLYDLLLPYEQYCAVLSWSEVCTGSNARSLGVLAAMLKRWDAAGRHFAKALEVNAKMGALTWLAQTQYDYAEMLLARPHSGGSDSALKLLRAARQTADQVGMARLITQIDALLSHGDANQSNEVTGAAG